MKRCVAFDLGATSGRVMVAEVGADVAAPRGGAPLPQRGRAARRRLAALGRRAHLRELLRRARARRPSADRSTASASTRGPSTTGCSTPKGRCSGRRTPTATGAPTASGRRSSPSSASRRCTTSPGSSSCRSTRSTSSSPRATPPSTPTPSTLLLLPDLLAYLADRSTRSPSAPTPRPRSSSTPPRGSGRCRCSSGSACAPTCCPGWSMPARWSGPCCPRWPREVGLPDDDAGDRGRLARHGVGGGGCADAGSRLRRTSPRAPGPSSVSSCRSRS